MQPLADQPAHCSGQSLLVSGWPRQPGESNLPPVPRDYVLIIGIMFILNFTNYYHKSAWDGRSLDLATVLGRLMADDKTVLFRRRDGQGEQGSPDPAAIGISAIVYQAEKGKLRPFDQ